MLVGEMNEFHNMDLKTLKEVCKGLATKLDGISINHTWQPGQYTASADEEKDRLIVDDAVELLMYFSEEL